MREQISKNGLYYRVNDFIGNRPTLVFVHGVSGSSSAWQQYEKFFEQKYNVLTFDLRGHGKSFKYKNYGDYKIEKIAEDINELAASLSINKFVLISHSFGAFIAFEFLEKYPDKAEAAIFLSPGFDANNRKLALLVKPLLKAYQLLAGILPFKPKTGGHIDYSKHKNTGDWNVRRMIADVGNTTLRIYLYATLQTYKKNYRELLEKIKIPILLIHGKKDTILPFNNSLFINQKIKNSKLVVLPNADHIIVLNNFSEVSNAIDKFLDSYQKDAGKI